MLKFFWSIECNYPVVEATWQELQLRGMHFSANLPLGLERYAEYGKALWFSVFALETLPQKGERKFESLRNSALGCPVGTCTIWKRPHVEEFCVRCGQIPTSTAGLEPSTHHFAERSTNLHLRVHSTVPRHMVVCANLSVWVLSHDTERQNQFILF